MQNASRRGAVDMGMPLMILAFIVIGGFMYWLSGQAAAERAARVVEEAPAEEEESTPMGGVELGEVTAVGADMDAFEGETIRGEGYEVASLFGTAGFWVNTATGNPFLVVYSEELRATGVTVAQGDYVNASGELLRMEISYLDEWLAEGLINDNDKIIGEFATHLVAADEVEVVDPSAGAGAEGDSGAGAGQ
jgi:molybdopterin converting factor small subunit